MYEQYVDKTKSTLEIVAYRNEQAMKFEKFVSKFTNAADELEKRNQWLHNSDVIDIIWKKMMNPELSQYVTALKVQFQRRPQYYQ